MTDKTIYFTQTLAEAFDRADIVYPNKTLKAGVFNRFDPAGKQGGKPSAWCKIYPDGTGAVFGDYAAGTSAVWQQHSEDAAAPTDGQRRAARAKAEEMHRLAAVELAEQHAKGAEAAQTAFNESTELDPANAYVVHKGITPYEARQGKYGSVLLPVFDAEGNIQSVQSIRADGQKRFQRGAKLKNGRLFLGAPTNGRLIRIAEGWATACSLHEATGDVACNAFAGSNMAVVAEDLRRQFPDSQLIVCGDLDVQSQTSARFALEAAKAGCSTIKLPKFADGRPKGDWNDLARDEGFDAVRAQLFDTEPEAVKAPCEAREIVEFIAPILPSCDSRDGTENTRPLTESGNALRLFDAYGEKIRYVPEVGKWLTWQGCWTWDDGAGIRQLAGGLARQIYREGEQHLKDSEHFAKWSRRSQARMTVENAVALFSDMSAIRVPMPTLDADQFLVGFDGAKQVIDLATGEIRPARQSDLITKSLGPHAVGDPAKAVRWLQFLDQVFDGDAELINWLKRFCGYLLTGSTREQIFLFCHGFGANGKSVLIETLKHVMSDYSRAIASETLAESKRGAGSATPDLAALLGARLVLSAETEDNTAMAESLVKSLVAGDTMSVRPLYGAPFEFQPNFKLVMAGNHRPVVRGNDHGLWRRVRLVPFNKTFSADERDPHLLDTLKGESDHILGWMLAGCLEWQRRGLADTPRVIADATAAYQVDQDITGAWLGECTQVSRYDEIMAADLYANYRQWSLDNGLKPASSNSLGRRLSERGFSGVKVGGKRIWTGLRLTDLRHERRAFC
jgi:P4 family phage/plasmid primase-like protien